MDPLYKTGVAAYWHDFVAGDEDMDRLYEFVLSEGKPHTINALVHRVIAGRCEDEVKKIAERRKKGAPYQPAENYSVGQRLSFAALDHRHGEVVGVRQGQNPRYGPFEVIEVKLEAPTETREFVSAFSAVHSLNLPLAPDEEAPSAHDLAEQYGHYVRDRLVETLQANPEFVSYDDLWLLKGLLLDVHEGHLNIAEAMIDVSGTPLPTEELIKELDLLETAAPTLQSFSLNYALALDSRFINAGSVEEPLWYLLRLTQEGEGA